MVWRHAWAAALVAAALGCSREATRSAEIKDPELALVPVRDTAHPAPPPPLAPSGPAASAGGPSSPSAPASGTSTPSPAPPPFALTELAPTQGDLLPLLKDQVARAQKRQLRPVVEFYADWCGPCRAFQASLTDPAMIEALRGTYLVKLNLDDWHDKLEGTGYSMKSIPYFYLVGSDGRPAGKALDGDKWGRSTVANMSAAIRAFLAP